MSESDVSGHMSAMLWNGVISIPRLSMKRCMYSSSSGSAAAADSPPFRGPGRTKRYSARAPSWTMDHGRSASTMMLFNFAGVSSGHLYHPIECRVRENLIECRAHRREGEGVARERSADTTHVAESALAGDLANLVGDLAGQTVGRARDPTPEGLSNDEEIRLKAISSRHASGTG